MSARELITEHLDLWTGAVTKKSSSGRGGNGKIELTGIKKLRELILELAVRGKLVAQNPTAEPATQLLSKTKALREQLVTEGKLRRLKQIISAEDAEKPFQIPTSWSWATLPDVASYSPGKTPSTKAPKFWATGTSGIPWVSIADLNHGRAVRETTKAVTQIAADEIFRSEPIAPGTILMSFKLTVGKVSITEVPAYHNEAIISILPFTGVSRDYLFKFMPMLALGGNTKRAIMGNTLNATSLAQILVPLPPEEEQHRIVHKVDELMAICDRLEQQTSDQLEAHETLVDTLLGTLTRSENATELADNWARLAAHFNTLFTTEQSIDKLKQTILQLAVMGRLVEQDAGDEPAENMLGQLAEVKKELITQGRLKKERKTQLVDSEDAPYEIPESWGWCSLTDIGELARGKSKHRPRNAPSLYQDGTVPLIQTGDVARASPWIKTFSAKYNQRGVEQSRLWRPGTLCITIAANIGDTGLLSFDACFPDSVVGFTPFWSDIPTEYFEYFLRTAKQHLEDFAPSTAQKNINLEVLQKLLVPLPPVPEMKRIVQKVDELMALCDQLKERLNQASETRCQLAEAIVEQGLSA